MHSPDTKPDSVAAAPSTIFAKFRGAAPLLLLAAAAYLYLNLFASPRTPFLLGGDQVSFWLRGLRMLDHARVYKDFYQFTPPGTDLLYLGLFRVFGPRLWVTNALVLVLGVALSWICFSISCRLMSRAWALLATALFLVTIYGNLLNGTHHWFSVLCVLIAVRIFMQRTGSAATLAVGALLGLASFFTQTRGVAALLAWIVFLVAGQLRHYKPWSEVCRQIGLLLSGFAVAWLLLDIHFIATAGLSRLIYFQIMHATRYIAKAKGDFFLGLPAPLTWRNLPKLTPSLSVYLLLPVIYLFTLWKCWRNRRDPAFPWEQLALLALTGLFLLLEIAPHVNMLRVYIISAPAFLLLGWALSRAHGLPRLFLPLLWTVIACVALWQTASRHRSQRLVLSLPAGRAAMSPESYATLQWLMERTKPGEFLFQARWPGVYLPLGLRNPSWLETIAPIDGPGPQDAWRVPQELEDRRVRFVLWSPLLDIPRTQNASEYGYLPRMYSYLLACYAPVHTLGNGAVAWQRRENGPCAAAEDLLATTLPPASPQKSAAAPR